MRTRSRRTPFITGSVVAAALTTYLGLIDFLIYEAYDATGHLRIFTIVKPSFIQPSLLLIQLGTVVAVGLGFFTVFSSLESLFGRWYRPPSFFSATPLAVGATSLSLIALRWWKGDARLFHVALLVVSCAVAYLWSVRLQSSIQNQQSRGDDRRFLRLSLIAVSVPFVLAFSLPEIARFSLVEPQTPDTPNVLLVVLDTVRADRLSCYGSNTTSTPNIDKISREGLFFRNAYSAGPWTVPSHASMFTGLRTSEHQADWPNTFLQEEFTTMAEFLGQVGYDTAGFSENPFVGRSHGMSQGFSTFFEGWQRPMLPRALSHLADRAGIRHQRRDFTERTSGIFRYWLDHKRKVDRPFFAFINYMAAHSPRYPRSRSYEKAALKRFQPVNVLPERYYLPQYALSDDDLSVMSAIYDEQIEFLDRTVGDLLAHLEAVGVLDETIVILTSDHGENFGEHGLIEHQFCLYNSLIRVPLIIRFPKMLGPREVRDNVSTVALFSTVVEMTGVRKTDLQPVNRSIPLHLIQEDQTVMAEATNGVDELREVLAGEAPDFDYSRFDRSFSCIIKNDYKLILDSSGGHELFSIEQDPREEHNLAASAPQIVERLKAEYQSPLTAGTEPIRIQNPTVLDPRTLDELRALGYIR